jgi:heme/copper-type cytochrome/quinol oxidase subunit 2
MEDNKIKFRATLSKTVYFIITHRVKIFLAVLVVIAVIVGLWREHSDANETAKAADSTTVSDTVSDSDSENSSSEKEGETEKEDERKDKFSIGWSNAAIFLVLAIALLIVKKKRELGTTDSDRKSKDVDEIKED